MKDLYTDFYDGMTELTKNVVCTSCGCIDHHLREFTSVSVNDASLDCLRVDPSLVPFDFNSGITTLDESHIMIDPNGIVDEASLYICRSCQKSLQANVLPPESLANCRWIGPVPPELQDLTWMEEVLIARAHLTGRIVRLQNRNSASHFSLKGHVILLPQDTTKLLYHWTLLRRPLCAGTPSNILCVFCWCTQAPQRRGQPHSGEGQNWVHQQIVLERRGYKKIPLL
jgi:hypothetical protein